MCLGNDNFIGYAHACIFENKVRWIEAAIAAPVWTTMICYYLEEDYGHLMTEPLFDKRHRVGARGNVFSYVMPWEEILQGLLDLSNTDAVGPPHPPEFLGARQGQCSELGSAFEGS